MSPPDPSAPRWITLLTDFGPRDAYIGIMKGVIASIAPEAMVVDLSHGVTPQDIRGGAFLLATSYRYFPSGTVNLTVIDPGVGGARAIIAAEVGDYCFVAPDNGLLSGVIAERSPERVVRVTNEDYFLPGVSSTFHGRDIMAPVAAYLTRGVDLGELGPVLDQPLVRLWSAAEPLAGGGLMGEVIYIDHFGNCITNLVIPDRAGGRIEVGGRELELLDHYGEVAVSEPLALRASSGYLEIAVREGSAEQSLGLERGASVHWTPGDRRKIGGRGTDPRMVDPRKADSGPTTSKEECQVPGTDRYRRMFGEVALEMGFVSAAQLYEALTMQAKRKADGKADKLLGQLLLELGYMDTPEVKQVIDVLYPVTDTD